MSRRSSGAHRGDLRHAEAAGVVAQTDVAAELVTDLVQAGAHEAEVLLGGVRAAEALGREAIGHVVQQALCRGADHGDHVGAGARGGLRLHDVLVDVAGRDDDVDPGLVGSPSSPTSSLRLLRTSSMPATPSLASSRHAAPRSRAALPALRCSVRAPAATPSAVRWASASDRIIRSTNGATMPPGSRSRPCSTTTFTRGHRSRSPRPRRAGASWRARPSPWYACRCAARCRRRSPGRTLAPGSPATHRA